MIPLPVRPTQVIISIMAKLFILFFLLAFTPLGLARHQNCRAIAFAVRKTWTIPAGQYCSTYTSLTQFLDIVSKRLKVDDSC